MSTLAAVSAGLGIRLTRKVRSDAKLERLSTGQRERLRVWLEDENRTYADVVARVRAEFGLCVGKSAVGVYYQRHIAAEPYDYDPDVEAAAVLATQPLERFSKTMLHRAKALAWLLLARPDPQINAADRLLKVVHRVEWQAIRRRRLVLQARRAALREILVARRATSAAAPATPAPSRDLSQNLPLFPGYARIIRPSAAIMPASAYSAFPPIPLSANVADPAALSPCTKTSANSPSISGLFPAVPALPRLPALLAA